MFARVLDSERYGQLLMKVQQDENGEVELGLYFQPPGFNVCSAAFGFAPTASLSREQVTLERLETITIEKAELVLDTIFPHWGE